MLELVIARHGQAHCNLNGLITGTRTCTGLTDHGRHQARLLADRLACETPPVALYASPTPRAAQTAAILAARLAMAVRCDDRLQPPAPGALDGLPWPTARKLWPSDPDNPDRPLAPHTEPWRDHRGRIGDFLAQLRQNHLSGRVLLVAHTETVTAAYECLVRTNLLHHVKIAVTNTALTAWQTIDERPNVHPPHPRWALISHNDHRHLHSRR